MACCCWDAPDILRCTREPHPVIRASAARSAVGTQFEPSCQNCSREHGRSTSRGRATSLHRRHTMEPPEFVVRPHEIARCSSRLALTARIRRFGSSPPVVRARPRTMPSNPASCNSSISCSLSSLLPRSPQARERTCPGMSAPRATARSAWTSHVALDLLLTMMAVAPLSMASSVSSVVCTSTTPSMPSTVHVFSMSSRSGPSRLATRSTAHAPASTSCAICSGCTMKSLPRTGTADELAVTSGPVRSCVRRWISDARPLCQY
mmetsp:Transcript_6895/g.20033  ORF Transcript_6895/g.20033 Transcript_6895/m.20033 type:complete len:263 (+) Transcript_6895:149-937(+)